MVNVLPRGKAPDARRVGMTVARTAALPLPWLLSINGRKIVKLGVPLWRVCVVPVELYQVTWVPVVTVTTLGLKPLSVIVMGAEPDNDILGALGRAVGDAVEVAGALGGL